MNAPLARPRETPQSSPFAMWQSCNVMVLPDINSCKPSSLPLDNPQETQVSRSSPGNLVRLVRSGKRHT